MQKPFEIINHTADIGLVVYGNDIKQIFSRAATGLFSLITDVEQIKAGIERQIELSSQDMESLLVDWLNELIYIFEVEHMLFKRFEINSLEDNRIRAVCTGEKINRQHRIYREVKAATYHTLSIKKYNHGLRAKVIFDL